MNGVGGIVMHLECRNYIAERQNSSLQDPMSYRRNVKADGVFFTRTMNPEITRSNMELVGKFCSWVYNTHDSNIPVANFFFL